MSEKEIMNLSREEFLDRFEKLKKTFEEDASEQKEESELKEVYEVIYYLKHGYEVSETVNSIHETGGINDLTDLSDFVVIENIEGTHVFKESDVIYMSYKRIPVIK